ncbi:MAG TPA: hypothetical protein VM266_15050 [Solirubrobacteraceae bacterium]|nr:hypothetical protein [Solirubrobacteraceae bacterium]
MDLLSDWRRRTFGAAAGAVVAPVAIVLAAVAVGIGGGGLRGIGAVGQAVHGPVDPRVAPAPGARNRDAAEEAGRLLTRMQARERVARPAARRPASAPTPAVRRPGSDRGGRPARPRPQAPAASPPPPAPTPQPTPTPTPGLVRQVGDEVKKVTDPVPVAGPPAGQVVDLIVETAESLPVPAKPRAALP